MLYFEYIKWHRPVDDSEKQEYDALSRFAGSALIRALRPTPKAGIVSARVRTYANFGLQDGF